MDNDQLRAAITLVAIIAACCAALVLDQIFLNRRKSRGFKQPDKMPELSLLTDVEGCMSDELFSQTSWTRLQSDFLAVNIVKGMRDRGCEISVKDKAKLNLDYGRFEQGKRECT